jgi:hypothetical protein
LEYRLKYDMNYAEVGRGEAPSADAFTGFARRIRYRKRVLFVPLWYYLLDVKQQSIDQSYFNWYDEPSKNDVL